MKILVIMVNNYGWMAIRDLQLDMFGNGYDFGNDFVLSDGSIYSPDFVTIADSFGFYSQKITQQNEVEEAVRNALSTFSPSFIEVIVERDYPFSGGIATGWWDVPVPYYIRNKDMEYRKSKKEEYIK